MEKVQASKKIKALSKYQVLQGDEILPAILGEKKKITEWFGLEEILKII